MDSEELRKVILENKSKGVKYVITHLETIKKLISDGETPSSIYEALKLSTEPPPISKSQFYRHLKKQKSTGTTSVPQKATEATQASVKPMKTTELRHDVLNQLKTRTDSIHDSGFDADKLI